MVRVAVIPVGGEAVRLRPLTVETSKAMVRLLNRPLVEFAVLQLARQGVREVYFGVRGYHNYRDIYDYFREGGWMEAKYGRAVRIRYMPRVETRGNAEAVLATLEYYGIEEPVVVVQGDNVFQLDLQDMYRHHEERKAFMTIALREEPGDLSEFGVAAVDEGLRILKFVEKPRRPEEAPSRLINTGIYMLSRDFPEFFRGEVGRKLYSEGKMDFGSDVIPTAIAAGLPVYGYVTKGYWFDVGTPERYLRAMRFLLGGLGAEELEADEVAPRVYVQGRSVQSRVAKAELAERIGRGEIYVEGTVLIGRHVKIGKGARIRNSVIDNYVVVGEGAEIEGSAVMDRAVVDRGAKVAESIVGRHSYVGEESVVESSVIADDVTVGPKATLTRVRVWPHRSLRGGVKLENFDLI